MSRFVTCLASLIWLLVILTGPSLACYPADPNDAFYQAFQTVPSPNVTAKKFMTNFLGYTGRSKRQTKIEDIVIVLDGSGSVSSCEFKTGKEALKHMMTTAHKPGYDTKYAAVTFSSTATVNFKFLPYSSTGSEMARISYPGGLTNTQAGLAEAKKLFDDPNSGRRSSPTRRMVLLLTDGQSNIDSHLTVDKAAELKRYRDGGVDIFVVAVGSYMTGIDELVKVASYPPESYLFRVTDLTGFWNIVKLIVKKVSPSKYHIVNYDVPCKKR